MDSTSVVQTLGQKCRDQGCVERSDRECLAGSLLPSSPASSCTKLGVKS